MYDGAVHEITEWLPTVSGTDVVLRGPNSLCRMSVVELVRGTRARLLIDTAGPESTDKVVPAVVALSGLPSKVLAQTGDRAAHVREVLTGFRSGSSEVVASGEPRPQFDIGRPLCHRYAAKADELDVDERTIRRWIKAYEDNGEAGLVSTHFIPQQRVDPRWSEAALAIMREHTEESKPSEKAVIYQVSKRLELCFGPGVVPEPSRATAYRELHRLDTQHRTFRGTTARNRDIATRPKRPYGKLAPTRPGEYVILDTTRLDVFGVDPITLQWTRIELTAAMDWYTRCIVALRLTPVSTKAVDAAALMYQVYRPPLAPAGWPDYAVWPHHGIPRTVCIDPDQLVTKPGTGASGPAVMPETIVVDHGKIYVSEHLNSVCQRFGISIQPARIREGRDKGPLERFFRTVREGLLQYLPGYKGPDINSRGLDVEGHAFFYIDQLEAIVREWIAVVYHHTRHSSLFDPHLPSATMTPAQMFAHGTARAGYLEAPRDPFLAYEFLQVQARTIQHYGVQCGKLRYTGDVLSELGNRHSPYTGKFRNKWPIHIDPDDISRVFIKHPDTGAWHTLDWEHAHHVEAPFSEEALAYARRIVLQEHGFADDQLALDELLTRWNLHMGVSAKERRMALRMARQDDALSHQVEVTDADLVAGLPSVQAVTRPTTPPPSGPDASVVGDDDTEEELADDYDDDGMDWV
ncbi:helix-turn-helix domain-containing protein [soil metagenome]